MAIRLIGRARHFALDGDVGDLVFESLLFGTPRGRQGDRRYWFEADDLEPINAARLVRFLTDGGNVQGAPMYIKMDATTYSTVPVPSELHRSTKIDPADPGSRLPRQWSEWVATNQSHIDAADGGKVVPGNSWGRALTKAEILVLDADTAYTLLLEHQVAAELPPEVTT